MENELINLVNTYNYNGKKVDSDFYKKVFDFCKQFYELDEYLKEFIFISEKEHDDSKYEEYTSGISGMLSQFSYVSKTGTFIVYEKNIDWEKRTELSLAGFDKNENQTIIFNLMVLQSFLHELEHVKQKKMMETGTDIESKMLRATFVNKQETEESFMYRLSDRLAEIKSYKKILDMYSKLGIVDQDIYEYFNKRYWKELTRGYDFEYEVEFDDDSIVLVCPTYKYMKLKDGNMDELLALDNLIEGNDRVVYGLPISNEEFIKISDEYSGLHI